jgi:GNAT superfamily N-acetyltransferase
MSTLTPEAITKNPESITEALRLNSGEGIIFRVLRADHGALLGRYFEGLSDETRGLFGPHPLTMDEAHTLCAEIDYPHTLRFIALADSGKQLAIVAYLILILGVRNNDQTRYQDRGMLLDERFDCTLAPSVADAYQNRGLGTALMPKVLDVARRLGRKRVVLWEGTQASNLRAIHFYEKFGFQTVGKFSTQVENYDMILNLD